ncbi:hypothetical protein FE784_20385 [Paenibacillus hemerocallicola]|uniref:Uncharacterized protein n=1 Tax=Paenibacillus hemerocallicola TaxID=1172614 RepID=A0A5C4T769_9BACL|nr:hypothetical protein [Paenibacillus hemerocallicola]TNJ64480.1 hypothetical protein FE784_20385 [Paenibacillus hemerocallicola]
MFREEALAHRDEEQVKETEIEPIPVWVNCTFWFVISVSAIVAGLVLSGRLPYLETLFGGGFLG